MKIGLVLVFLLILQHRLTQTYCTSSSASNANEGIVQRLSQPTKTQFSPFHRAKDCVDYSPIRTFKSFDHLSLFKDDLQFEDSEKSPVTSAAVYTPVSPLVRLTSSTNNSTYLSPATITTAATVSAGFELATDHFDKPLAVLEGIDMPELHPTKRVSSNRYTRNNGDALLLLDTAGAYARQTINIPASGMHRVDISARSSDKHADGTWAAMQIQIDGANVGSPISVPTNTVNIFSLSTNISRGIHKISVVSLNNGAINKYKGRLYLGLIYVTKTLAAKPPALPIEPPSPLVKGKILTANHFKSKVLRGFNVGTSINYTNQSFIEMRATGANLARLWMNLNRTAGTDTFAFSSGALAAMDIHVALAAQKGFYVVIVLNPKPDALLQEYWGNSASAVSLRNSIKKRWVQIANRYKGNVAVAGYDLINEPRYQHYGFWINWSSQLIEAIRAIDQDHVIIVEHSYSEQMFERIILYPYSNIVYSPHGYPPLNITHQGISGKERLKYPLNTAGETQKVFTKKELFKSLSQTKTFVSRFNVAIFVGEFSCINWAPVNTEGKWSSTTWVNDKISLLEAEGWSWAYHAWREYEGWDAEIPSSLYNGYSFRDAKPVVGPSVQRAARTSSAPTITMLRNWFRLNGSIQTNTDQIITKAEF